MMEYNYVHFTHRCSYSYDALENLHKRSCTGTGEETYFMDPFGVNGQDVIAKVTSIHTSNTKYYTYEQTCHLTLLAYLETHT